MPRPASQTLYGSAEWKRYARGYLAEHRWCVCPKHQGKVGAKGGARSTVVDHIRKHRGDLNLFWDPSNHQALAKTCHDSWKRQMENDEARHGDGVYAANKRATGKANPESSKGYLSRGVGSPGTELEFAL